MSTGFDHMNMETNDEILSMVGYSPGWKDYGLRAAARSRDICPVGKTEMETGTYGPAEPHGALKASMVVRYQFGKDPRIEIGSTLQGKGGVNIFALNELGTDAHAIDAAPGGVLTFVSKGVRVFTTHVNHPGTKKNPFVERAAQQVIHEMGGIRLVAI